MSQKSSYTVLLSLFSTSVLSQTLTTDTVVISADRIKTSLEKTTNSIQIINEKKITDNKSLTIEELLKQEANINIVTSGPAGNSSSIFLRGTESSHTLVVLDGIVLNDPTNPNRSFDFSKISLKNLEKIEILSGSQGLLYGSNAIGGVIVLTSKKNITEGARNELYAEFGRYDSTKFSLSTFQKIANQNVRFSAEHYNTDGFSSAKDPSHPNDNDGAFKQTYQLGINGDLKDDLHYDFVSHLTLDKVDLDKTGGQNGDDPNYKSKSQEIFSKLELNKQWSELSESTLKYSYVNYLRRTFDQADSYQSYLSNTYYKGSVHNVDINNTYQLNSILTQSLNIGTSRESDTSHHVQNSNAFLYNKIDLENFEANAGLRVDYHEYFNSHLTYKLGLAKTIEQFKVRVSHGTGFRAPSLNQLFDPTYGNKQLKPEQSKNYEIGFDYFVKKYQGTFNFYYTYLTDRLTYNSSYVNINSGRAQYKGVEHISSVQISDDLKYNFKANITNSKNIETGIRLSRRPDFQMTNSVSYHLEKHAFNLDYLYVSSRNDLDNNSKTVHLDSYGIFNIDYRYSINENNELSARVKNLFDTDYTEVYGYNTGGRIFALGYNLKF